MALFLLQNASHAAIVRSVEKNYSNNAIRK